MIVPGRQAIVGLMFLTCVAIARPAHAVLDVENRGPTLTAGAFGMRVTNIGVIGNPFFDIGRSFDPSFEYPRGSGNELLKEGDLWVGARDANGVAHVSGGPILEWRPTPAPEDHVRIAYGGAPGTLRLFDDDGDGRIDEEILNGKDDDGDGEVDEDLGLFATQTAVATYADDTPEAINYAFPNGERHVPLHLNVTQEAFCWNEPGFDNIAGLRFTVTNHGTHPLTDVMLGFFADLEARQAGSAGGHLDDVMVPVHYSATHNDGFASVPKVLIAPEGLPYFKICTAVEEGTQPAVIDANPASGVAGIVVVPMSHTTDPLGLLPEQGRVSRAIVEPFLTAPTHLTFQTSLFANDLPTLQGGPPVFDEDRYRALRGEYPTVQDTLHPHDYVVLVRCGPFPLQPGASITMDLALVASPPESLAAACRQALLVHHGGYANILPDTVFRLLQDAFVGKSGVSGHETCYEPPVGLEFEMDPHCLLKYGLNSNVAGSESSAEFAHGYCVWADMDCDVCTGFDGNETRLDWQDPATVPVPPSWRTVAGDHQVTIEWDNKAELLQDQHLTNGPGTRFIGYNLYRLDDWSHRRSDVPEPGRFQQVASFVRDTTLGGVPLETVIDSAVDYERVLYEQRLYPVGRYRWTDVRAQNGFDYVYVLTAVSERIVEVVDGQKITERIESPFLTGLDSVVTPHATAGVSAHGGVWVVPNPYRAHAPWDKPAVPGDVFTKHIDFMGLPRARCRVRIYTLAGDLVAVLDHDGTNGNGQARWDLISRNGQDTESGVYLFTVEWAGGHQVGRFVMIR